MRQIDLQHSQIPSTGLILLGQLILPGTRSGISAPTRPSAEV